MDNCVWEKALKILNQNGYEAYLVGGAVRDYLLKLEPHDFDITTSAKPTVIKELFCEYKTLNIGEKHGTITVFINDIPLEITTYRSEDNYLDNRHPEEVTFISSLNEDLKRRDFTINALLMNQNHQVIDLVDGIKDLNNHIIRAIGNPEDRFREDALRILRAIRLKSQYGFTITSETDAAIFNQAHLLAKISQERVAEEFMKIVKNQNIEVLKEYQAVFNPLLEYDYNEVYLCKTDNYLLKLAILFKNHPNEIDKLFLAKSLRIKIVELIKHQNADNLIANFSEVNNHDLYLNYLEILYNRDFKNIYADLQPYIANQNNLAITNQELIKLGYQGPEIGKIKNYLIQNIRSMTIKNDRTAILNLLKKKG